MASLHCLRYWCLLLILLCFSISPCESYQVHIVGRALTCFDSHHVYSNCQDSYQLKVEGFIKVPLEATDEYCNGPCLTETELLLSCVDDMINSFRFHNGASVRDVHHALKRGCSHSTTRGDFYVRRHDGYEDEYNGDVDYDDCFDHGIKLAIPNHFLIIYFSCLLLLLI